MSDENEDKTADAATTEPTSEGFIADGDGVDLDQTSGPLEPGAEEAAETEVGNDLPKTTATSSVTSDLPMAEEDTDALQEAHDALPAEQRQSIGLIKVDGIDKRYVGVSPGRDQSPKTDNDFPVTTLNSTFTPLSEVPFSNSIQVKDPATGTFYFPADGCTSWKDCQLDGNYLIER